MRAELFNDCAFKLLGKSPICILSFVVQQNVRANEVTVDLKGPDGGPVGVMVRTKTTFYPAPLAKALHV